MSRYPNTRAQLLSLKKDALITLAKCTNLPFSGNKPELADRLLASKNVKQRGGSIPQSKRAARKLKLAKSKKIPVSGTKQQLVDRLIVYKKSAKQRGGANCEKLQAQTAKLKYEREKAYFFYYLYNLMKDYDANPEDLAAEIQAQAESALTKYETLKTTTPRTHHRQLADQISAELTVARDEFHNIVFKDGKDRRPGLYKLRDDITQTIKTQQDEVRLTSLTAMLDQLNTEIIQIENETARIKQLEILLSQTRSVVESERNTQTPEMYHLYQTAQKAIEDLKKVAGLNIKDLCKDRGECLRKGMKLNDATSLEEKTSECRKSNCHCVVPVVTGETYNEIIGHIDKLERQLAKIQTQQTRKLQDQLDTSKYRVPGARLRRK